MKNRMNFSGAKALAGILIITALSGCIQAGDAKTGALESVVEQNRTIQENLQKQQREAVEKQKQLIGEEQARRLAFAQKRPGNPAGEAIEQQIKKPEEGTGSKAESGVAERPKAQKASVTANSRAANITHNANWKCVPNSLKSVVYEVARRYGHVTINSTHRSRSRNRRAGGAGGSYHLRCQAVDFRVKGNTGAVMKFLRSNPNVGGLKRYRSGFIHIDTGPRRSWR